LISFCTNFIYETKMLS